MSLARTSLGSGTYPARSSWSTRKPAGLLGDLCGLGELGELDAVGADELGHPGLGDGEVVSGVGQRGEGPVL
jgi:hypothetical protein